MRYRELKTYLCFIILRKRFTKFTISIFKPYGNTPPLSLTNFLETIQAVLASYTPIDLASLARVGLLNRIDTKFVLHAEQVAELLREIEPNYYSLEIENKRAFAYETLYFDTDDFQLYKQHHNGKLNRLKVRFRRYADSDSCFFEVKQKVKGGTRTDKKRVAVAKINTELSVQERALVFQQEVDNSRLNPKLWVYFTRITLVSCDFRERLTLDMDIRFDNNRREKSYPELVVVEIKSEKLHFNSPIIKALKARHLEPISFSKYSVGIALLEAVKSNNFKPNFIKINKLLRAIY